MTHALAITALALLLVGTAEAQQKPAKRSAKSTTGSVSANDAARSNPSTANTHDGTNGASTGTGLTNDQLQGQGAGSSTSSPTKVDAQSSVRTGPSTVKARKKSPKSDS